MEYGKLLHTAGGLFQAKLLKRKKPLVVGWAITDQCNRKCAYCAVWKRPHRDLETSEVLRVVDQLAQAGTLRVSFTGGEPLLREDMGDIIRYVHDKGIETKMNSNGTLVTEKVRDLDRLDMLTLSLEGPAEIHDAIRGRGSFADVRQALGVAREHGIHTGLATVLTSMNLDAVDEILDIAREGAVRVMFQPATPLQLGGNAVNDLSPPVEPYRRAVDRLIARKKSGDQHIANSIAGLQHLRKWPDPTPMACACGWISCRIEPDGRVLYCSRETLPEFPQNCVRVPFGQAFKNLTPMVCHDCWCAARVELNLAFSLNRSAIKNQIKAGGGSCRSH